MIFRGILICLLVYGYTIYAGDLTDTDVQKFVEVQKRQKGLALVLGSAESGLEVIKGTSMYVHTIVNKEDDLQSSRKLLDSKKYSHRGSVITCENNLRLPYADHLINLVVVTEAKEIVYSAKEVLRVMTPKAYLFIARSNIDFLKEAEATGLKFVSAGSWAYAEKLTPSSFDGWSHIYGSANQSYTNHDSAVGPWDEIRWIADPMWGSLYGSYISMVTNGGIIYYQEAHTIKSEGRWFLIARDAYNGTELWRENIGGFLKYIRNPDFTNCCDQNNIYYREENSVISREGLTGKKLQTFTSKIPPEFSLIEGKVLILCSKSLMEAFDKTNGKLLWSNPIDIYPAAENNILYLVNDNFVKAFEIETGKELWSSSLVGFNSKLENRLFCKNKNVFVTMKQMYKSDQKLIVYDAKTGNLKWEIGDNWGYGTLPYNDNVWLLNYNNKGENRNKSVQAKILNADTGKIEKDYFIEGSAWGHCWSARGTEKFLLYSNGWYYDRNIKLTGEGIDSTRSPCRIGQIPANGLTYFLPHHCDCKVTLRGFLGLAPKGIIDWTIENENRLKLVKTYTYSADNKIRPNDWPMYRNNFSRTNSTDEIINGELAPTWDKKHENSKLTQVSVVNGIVYVGYCLANKICAYKETTGELLWTFIAESSVLASPSINDSLCIFGTSGGYVYALNNKTGDEYWRLRVTPVQKYIGDCNIFASPWPVQGSILIKNNMAYLCAGRSSSQDLGLFLFGIDITNGKIVWSQNITKEAFCSDLFFADEKKLYTYETSFDFATGKMDKSYKPSKQFLKTTNYLNKVSILNYIDSIDPHSTDKRHVHLFDGKQQGDIISSKQNMSVVAGRVSTTSSDSKEKHGQFFLRVKGEYEWAHENMDIQIFGLVTTKDKVYAAGKNLVNLKSALRVFSLSNGALLQDIPIEGTPIYDAIVVSNGRVYLSTEEGNLYCFLSTAKN